MLEPLTAVPLATYAGKLYAGGAAIERNRFGTGKVDYIGVMGSDALIEDWLRDVAKERGLKPQRLADGIFVIRRGGGEYRFAF